MHWFANLAKGDQPAYSGERARRARQRLREAVAAFRDPAHGKDWDRLETAIGSLNVEFPAYMAGGAGAKSRLARLNAFLLLKYVEASPFTFALLRDCYPAPKAGAKTPPAPEKIGPGSGDPIQRARGGRGFVFPAFTSLPAWGGGTIRWKEFDIAAFKEALKAINQAQQKATERAEEAEKIQRALDWMEARRHARPPRAEKGDEAEQAEIPVLGGDPRWPLVQALLNDELAAENYLAPGEPIPYGLARRTLRGFRDLRDKWRKVVKADQAHTADLESKLLEITGGFQTANPGRIGSVNLFRALAQGRYWQLWQEPTEEEDAERRRHNFADDILFAHCQYLELQAELGRLREAIRFTPADAEQSRRQFLFSDLAGKSVVEHLADAPDGRLRVKVSLARPNAAGHWAESRATLHYTAPRLLRDRLRRTAGEDLETASWLAPMVAAFRPADPTAQDLRQAPVGLLPDKRDGRVRVLLNFPLTLQPDFLRQLGDGFDWEQQVAAFGNGNSLKRFYLRWPAQQNDRQAAAGPWWRQREQFHCLAVDLGQRDAGGFALLRARVETASAGSNPEQSIGNNGQAGRLPHGGRDACRGPERAIGDDGAKNWCVPLAACGLMRLPGEDAKILRNGEWSPEPYGEKGRAARAEETAAAEKICRRLGQDPAEWLGPDSARLSFPRQNTQLLHALRRAQGDLARCQRWLWMLGDEQKRSRARAEICGLDPSGPRDAWRGWAASGDIARLQAALRAEIVRWSETLPPQLIALADRCLPLRGRRCVWAPHPGPQAARCHQLTPIADSAHRPRLAGQRGLSMERIEQLEGLRQRCQSLNKALQREPGAPPPRAIELRDHPLPDPCPEILAKLDRLKRQRVSQTAHWIRAEALGVRPRLHSMARAERAARDQHAEYERIPGRAPTDFIVMEDLSRYLSSQDRPPRENGRLMQWCHRQILAKVKELAEPFGIAVLETAAAYSSRFCSRTGAAGFRAADLTSAAMGEWPWRNLLANPDGDRYRDAVELFTWLRAANQGREGKKPRCLIAPDRGGPLFVSFAKRVPEARRADEREPPPRWVMQADINAAINLGLRAIAAPDAADIHVRIRAQSKNGAWLPRTESGREKARWGKHPPPIELTGGGKTADSGYANIFVDIACVAPFDRAKIAGVGLPLASGRGLWTAVRQREWEVCREINLHRLKRWGVPLPASAAAAPAF